MSERVVVENNSTSGDNVRDSVKQSAEHVKDKIRDTLGKRFTVSLINSLKAAFTVMVMLGPQCVGSSNTGTSPEA